MSKRKARTTYITAEPLWVIDYRYNNSTVSFYVLAWTIEAALKRFRYNYGDETLVSVNRHESKILVNHEVQL